jgi:transposase
LTKSHAEPSSQIRALTIAGRLVHRAIAAQTSSLASDRIYVRPLENRGYDADWIRELATAKGAWANIPPKSNRNDPICFSPYLYRARNRVERFFNRIKQCRRVATRYDRLAANDLAFVQLASIRLWLRLNESAS